MRKVSGMSRGERREVELAQGTVRYADTGPVGDGGPVLVFVHGLLLDGELWRDVVALLAGTSRCVTPDLPMGAHRVPMRPKADLGVEGQARIIADLLAALDLRDVVLVGNDTGGGVAQVVATDHPERLAGLVLTPCDAFEHFPPWQLRPLTWMGRWAPWAARPLLRALQTRAGRWALLAAAQAQHTRMPDALVADLLRGAFQDAGIRRDLVKLLAGVPRHTLTRRVDRLAAFDRPALVTWSRSQTFFPLADAQRLAGVLPDATLRVTGDSTVFLPADQPSWLAEQLAAFLPRVAARRVRTG
jgi:pimeloyl-ACP methyl ester carboxylesterase